MKRIFLFSLLGLLLTTPAFASSTYFSSNLYYGLTGNSDVIALQEFLTAQGDYSGPISGNFFSLTAAAVKKFQAAQGLPQSGYFGVLSRAVANTMLSSQLSTPPQESSIQSTTQTNYANYAPLMFSQYQNNPANYIGQSVIVTGMNDSFIPSTGAIGSTSFVEVENPFDLSQPKIELEIPDSTSYTAVVNALQDKSVPIHLFVRAYGTGVADQSFTETSLLGSATVSMPTVLVTRLDQCLHGSMQTTVLTGTSFESNFSCTQWQTIFPAGIVQSTVTPSSNSQSTFTTPSGAVIDQYGNVITPAPVSAQSQAATDQAAAQSFYTANHTCVGLTGTQYADCLNYAYNH